MKKILLALALMLGLHGIAHAQLFPIPLQGCSGVGGCQLAGTTFTGISISWQSQTAARYFMVFDSTSSGNNTATSCSTTQTNGCLAYCLFVPTSTLAPGSFTLDWTLHPVLMRNGVYVALSTGAGCGTYTPDGANNYFYSQNR